MGRTYDVHFAIGDERVTVRGRGNTRNVAERSARRRLRDLGYPAHEARATDISIAMQGVEDAIVEPVVGRFYTVGRAHKRWPLNARQIGRGALTGRMFDRILLETTQRELASETVREWLALAYPRLRSRECELVITVTG